MDFIGSFLRVVAPGVALKRVQNQMAFDTLTKAKRRFDGAGQGRRFNNTGIMTGSQNSDINQNLITLRQRSRDAAKNNPYAKNGVRRIANNVIGTGILANPIAANSTALKAAKKAWQGWADFTHCDFDGLQNFYGIEHLVMKTVAKSGECYVRRIWKKKKKNQTGIPLKLQVLDPDFIDHGKNSPYPLDNGEYTVAGIQYNKDNERIAYWVFDRHPNEVYAESKPVPSDDIIHVFEVDDPGQMHGLPFASSILLRMQDFDDFEDAQLMKQKIAACFSAFVTQSADSGLGGADADELTERVEPGIIQRLNPGEEVTFASPPVVEGFRDFSRQNLQGQAAGMGMSYESYSGDLSGVNFSSGRMGWLEFQRGVEILQWNMIIPMFLNKVWDWFIQAAYLSGAVRTMNISVTWTPPRREMIDPLKEIQAKIKQIRAGLISWQDAVRELGYNPDEIIAQMSEDKKRFDENGLMPESDARYDADKMAKVEKNETD